MKFTLLGTGTSQGIPVIGCKCSTCLSDDPRDKRLRCSALVRSSSASVAIDIGPDFREQALRANLDALDAVILTHEHNDHVIGLDDLRPLIFKQRKSMTIYAEKRVLNEVKSRFAYAFGERPYPGAPSFELHSIGPGDRLNFGDISIELIRVYHGSLPIIGCIVCDKLAYLTDINRIPDQSAETLQSIDILVLDALRKHKHHSHNSLEEAIKMAASINASQTFLIHMSHLMGPTREWEKSLPHDVMPSYDGLSFELHGE